MNVKPISFLAKVYKWGSMGPALESLLLENSILHLTSIISTTQMYNFKKSLYVQRQCNNEYPIQKVLSIVKVKNSINVTTTGPIL